MKTINKLKASGRCLKTPAFFMCFSSGRRGDYQHPVDQTPPLLLPSHSLEKSHWMKRITVLFILAVQQNLKFLFFADSELLYFGFYGRDMSDEVFN